MTGQYKIESHENRLDKPSSSCSIASASSSDVVQPRSCDSVLLEEATSFNAEHIASACIAVSKPSSKVPRLLGDTDPIWIIEQIEVMLVNKFSVVNKLSNLRNTYSTCKSH